MAISPGGGLLQHSICDHFLFIPCPQGRQPDRLLRWGHTRCQGGAGAGHRKCLEYTSSFRCAAEERDGRGVGDGGDDGDISGVRVGLEQGIPQGIENVWSTGGAFLAQLTSGKVVAWGHRPPAAHAPPAAHVCRCVILHDSNMLLPLPMLVNSSMINIYVTHLDLVNPFSVHRPSLANHFPAHLFFTYIHIYIYAL